MKRHPLFTVSAVLYMAHTAITVLITVYYSIFTVMLAEVEDPTINIGIMFVFLICAMLTVLMEFIAGHNAINGDSLLNLKQFSVSSAIFNMIAVLSGLLCHQIWQPFVFGIVISVLYLYGLQKTIDA